MSGRLPIHINDRNAELNVYNLPRNMTGLVTEMKLARYAAHQVDEWDAGMATPDHLPT